MVISIRDKQQKKIIKQRRKAMNNNYNDKINGFYGVIYSKELGEDYDYAQLYDNREAYKADETMLKQAGVLCKELSYEEFIQELSKLTDLAGTISIVGSKLEGYYKADVEAYRRNKDNNDISKDNEKLKRAEAVRKINEWEKENIPEGQLEVLTVEDNHTGIIMVNENYISTMDLITAAEMIDKGDFQKAHKKWITHQYV